MNKAFVALVGVSTLVASAAGFAGGPTAASAPADNGAGFYLNGNVGYGRYDVDNDFETLGVRIDRDSFAWSANVGYQFNPYVAIEAGYMGLPYAKVTTENRDATTDTVKLKTHAVTLVAKGIYPINEQFDVFGKAGLAYETQSDEASVDGGTVVFTRDKGQITPLFGLGVDYNISQNWAVGLQGITTLKQGNEYPATYTALAGVTYKFS